MGLEALENRSKYLPANIVGSTMGTELNVVVELIKCKVSLNVFVEVGTVCGDTSTDQQFVTVEFHNL